MQLLPTLRLPALLLLACALLAACNSEQGSGIITTEIRSTSAFTEIENNSSVEVVVRPLEELGNPVVSVEADDNLQDNIEVVVQEDALVVNVTEDFDATQRPRVLVDIYTLTRLSNRGSGEISNTLGLDGTLLRIVNEGSGQVDLNSLNYFTLNIQHEGGGQTDLGNLTTDLLNVELSGSGLVTLVGTNDSLMTMNVTSSGGIRAFNCLTRLADCNVSGSGVIEVNASEQLDATVSGSGSIRYRDNLFMNLNSEVTGSGSVVPITP